MPEILQPTDVSCDWYDVPCVANAFGDWFYNFVLWVPRKVFEWLCEVAIIAINALPLPTNLWTTISAGYAALNGSLVPDGGNPAAIGSLLGLLVYMTAIGPGMVMMVGALTARFLLRRIPGIG